MKDIVIASNNKGKLNDFKVIFPDLNIIPISDLVEDFDVDETGTTFEANAKLKSLAGAKAVKKTVIADDSGLEVTALNNEPGVYSARYAGNDKDDNANIEKVLDKLGNETNRDARFVCVISMTTPEGETKQFRGELNGEITLDKIGEEGFGYDPIFYVSEKNKTLAQMSAEDKNEISHRKKAIAQLQSYLEGEN
ncbi:XTP/dITP diphosphatase [Staphylococcus durrellii]|uniref:XTP/dITP diphosphatase n=1 Tax=Staphylococcus durrellii TaxID=2781773 RepID=UPI00189CD4BF|nr:XTP/dITP diphosphatase [Staphylococcus durrellii]MBF7017367.1 XTP/dITP diphosphatase [Staphylococcus durrellii]